MNKKFLFFIVLMLFLSFQVRAQNSCRKALNPVDPVYMLLMDSQSIDPLELLIALEQNINVPPYFRSVPNDYMSMNLSVPDIPVNIFSDSPTIEDFFTRENGVLFPQHPLNQSNLSPGFDSNIIKKIEVRSSMSRSFFFRQSTSGTTNIWSIKAPTNFVRADAKIREPRANMSTHLNQSRNHMELIRDKDKNSAWSSKHVLIKDSLIVQDEETKNGYLVRDYREIFEDESLLWVPLASLPFFAETLAKLNKMHLPDFYATVLAKPFGELMAELLIKYGMQLETPHGQNILVAFDRDLKPTGKLALRDLGDSLLIKPLHAPKSPFILKDEENEIELSELINPNFSAITMAAIRNFNNFRYKGKDPLKPLYKRIRDVFDQSYFMRISALLGISYDIRLQRELIINDDFKAWQAWVKQQDRTTSQEYSKLTKWLKEHLKPL